MTDIEMTRLCAEAMGWHVSEWSHMVPPPSASSVPVSELGEFGWHSFDPLLDDAQAMALVKKFSIDILWSWAEQVGCRIVLRDRAHPDDLPEVSCDYKDLNRAIVECCARMQAAKAV